MRKFKAIEDLCEGMVLLSYAGVKIIDHSHLIMLLVCASGVHAWQEYKFPPNQIKNFYFYASQTLAPLVESMAAYSLLQSESALYKGLLFFSRVLVARGLSARGEGVFLRRLTGAAAFASSLCTGLRGDQLQKVSLGVAGIFSIIRSGVMLEKSYANTAPATSKKQSFKQ